MAEANALTNGIPEGWYDDPAKPDMERWWTGAAWTDHVRYSDRTRLHAVTPEPEPIVPAGAMFSPAPIESYSAAGFDDFYVPMRTIQTRSTVRPGSASSGVIALLVVAVVGISVGVALWLLLS